LPCLRCFFLDADDWLAADALARLIEALRLAPGAVAAAGAYTDIRCVRIPPAGVILRCLLVRNLFANGGHLLIRAEAIRSVGLFRSDIAYGEDREYWIRLALRGPFAVTADKAPVLYVRQHDGGAYRRLAANPASFVPCMEAIFGNPALLTRFGSARLAAIRRPTEAENAWIIGRELVRHGGSREGRVWLRRSVWAAPSLKRIALLAASVLPIGPFVPYATARRTSFACNEPTSPCGRKMMNITSKVP
jgi:GT2 family glycosyltransferase